MATPIPEITEIEIDGVVYKVADEKARESIMNFTPGIPSLPQQVNIPRYTGSPITPEFSNFNTEQLEISGETTATTVGSHTVSFTPKEGFKWWDNSTDAKTVTWVINKKLITPPSLTASSKTYTGSAIPAPITGYDSATMNRAGDYGSQTNFGTYTASFTLKDTANTEWDGVTGNAVSLTWYITRANGSLTISPTSLTLNVSSLTRTITVDKHGSNGAVSVSSSDSATASVTDNGNGTYTITGKKRGNATISFTMAQGTNHTAVTTAVNCAVTVSLPSTNLAENDWSDLSAIGAAGNGASYFQIGAAIPVVLNGTVGTRTFSNKTLYVFLIGINHKGVNGLYFQGFKTAATNGKDVALCDWNNTNGYGDYKTEGTKLFNMNHWGNYNYGGWGACDMRYDILGSTNQAPPGYGGQRQTSHRGADAPSNTATSPKSGTLMAALPASLRACMKPWTVYSDGVGNSSNVSGNVLATVDYLPLLSEFEVQGTRTYANQYEQNNQAQFDYYKNGNSKVKYNDQKDGTAVLWWCRSADYNSDNFFCLVNTDGSANYSYACCAYGVAPAFRVA